MDAKEKVVLTVFSRIDRGHNMIFPLYAENDMGFHLESKHFYIHRSEKKNQPWKETFAERPKYSKKDRCWICVVERYLEPQRKETTNQRRARLARSAVS